MTLLIVCNGFSSLIVDGKNSCCCWLSVRIFFPKFLRDTRKKFRFSFTLKLTAASTTKKISRSSLCCRGGETRRYQHFLYDFNFFCFFALCSWKMCSAATSSQLSKLFLCFIIGRENRIFPSTVLCEKWNVQRVRLLFCIHTQLSLAGGIYRQAERENY